MDGPLNRTTTVEVDRPLAQVTRLTLVGPQTRGALTLATFAALGAAVSEAGTDRDTRVVVITGTLGSFCSGLDLKFAPEITALTVEEMLDLQELAARAILAVRAIPQPVIAAVSGPAAGAGLSLALAADIAIAVPEATFTAAFVRVGLTGGDCGSSWLLPRAVGLARASELLLTGRKVTADEAERIGLVARVVPAEQLEDATAELAESLIRNSPLGLELTKRILQANVDAPSLEVAVEAENRNQVLASRSGNFPEALAAYTERRAPTYRT